MKTNPYVLGLDLGTNSIGWACVALSKNAPSELLAQGARIFEAGLEIDTGGKGTPLNLERRTARQRRRQHDRRKRRILKVRRILQSVEMLPANKPEHNDAAWKTLLAKDPYALRAKALDEKIELQELGLCIYQFAHRRGFLSNSKAIKKDDDRGKFYEETEKLASEMSASGARTWGEHLNRLDPHAKRHRERYTLRGWYKAEFDLIWQKQQEFYPSILTKNLYDQVKEALFFQRPLKSQAHLIGCCELEPKRKRAPLALLMAQEFRILQSLNHLKIISPYGKERELTSDERKKAFDLLQTKGDRKFDQLRKKIGLQDEKFNLERGGETVIKGNNTNATMIKIFGPRWVTFSDNEQNQIIEDYLTIGNTDAFIKRMNEKWGLDKANAEKFSDTELEQKYCAFSRKALTNLLPHLHTGLPITDAIQKAYPNHQKGLPVKDFLPPLDNLRNPIVQRTLSELRRLLTAIIKEHGKPETIRIELARDMKQNEEKRMAACTHMRERQRQREKTKATILKETGNPSPNSWEIEKVLLWEECQGECPYTGIRVSLAAFLNGTAGFDVEHIIPFSRSFDNSFANKTLCEAHYNRNVKKNKTPYEAASEKEFEAIIGRVRRFNSDYADTKLDRFNLREVDSDTEFIADFAKNQLTDTRYASRLAGEYLGQLYGSDWRKHIQIAKGGTTKYLRDAWELNRILSDGGAKNRADHRHHAVDAIVVALTSPLTVKSLSDANKRAPEHRRYSFYNMPLPWETFQQDVQQAIENITVSHRVDRKANGQLHQETFYGIVKERGTGKSRAVLRTALEALTEPDIAKGLIVDPAIRTLVEQKLKELGQEPKKAFKDRNNHPFMMDKNGNKRFIHKVRVYQNVNPVAIAENRNVKLGGNHHLEIFEAKDKKGNPTWKCEVVSLFAARQRVKEGKPVVSKQDTQGNPLKFSFSIGEAVQMDWNGERVTAVVQKMSNTSTNTAYVFRLHNDARKVADTPYEETITIKSDTALFITNLQKVVVLPTGQIRTAND